MRTLAVFLLVVASAPLLGHASAGAGPAAGGPPAGNGSADGPRIVSAYPNPVADGDAGEAVTVAVPPGTRLDRYRLRDDDAVVELPARIAGGRVTLSTDPGAVGRLVEGPVYRLREGLELANGGERLRLRRGNATVDTLRYRDAPEGSRRIADEGWRPLGATDRPVVVAGNGTVRAFALPDAPEVPIEHLRAADRRILLAGYTLTSGRVADALVGAARRGVTVRVLVDGDPVGGLTRRQATVLDRLGAAGVEVRALGGERARYAFHHAKYAVSDDRALVTTENWKPAGVGATSSRGWGVVTAQPAVVRGLADTFRADAGWHDAIPWNRFRRGRSFETANASEGRYPSRFDPATVAVDRTRLLVAPDNAEPELLELIGNATESIAIQQVSVGDRGQPFLRATLAAARRGVRVRILLSDAWYTREDNRALVGWLNDRADSEDLPLTARLADPGGRFEKVHTKGMIVDGDRVALGSLNWNNNSARRNRETVLILAGDEVGAYFGRVFEADWPDRPGFPAGLVFAIALLALLALRVARGLEFE